MAASHATSSTTTTTAMTASCHADNALGSDMGLYPRIGHVHRRVVPSAMSRNRALAYGARQLLSGRFEHGSEFRLLFLEQPPHVSPVFPGQVSADQRPGRQGGAVLAHLGLQQVS
jgi:hypothetical protein